MTITKDDFAALSNRFESVGLLPKGKTADLLENFDFVTAQAEAEAKAASDERPTIPEGDSSEGGTFVRGRGKNKNPPPDAA